MSIVEVIAWLMFGAIWVGLVTVAILVILMALGVTRSVVKARATAVSKSIIPAKHQTVHTR
jgi:membrane protein implicated in regulation of membrane protease activity